MDQLIQLLIYIVIFAVVGYGLWYKRAAFTQMREARRLEQENERRRNKEQLDKNLMK